MPYVLIPLTGLFAIALIVTCFASDVLHGLVVLAIGHESRRSPRACWTSDIAGAVLTSETNCRT